MALSSLLLRERGCGQVDIARFRRGIGLELYEAKSRGSKLSFSQKLRLRRSAQLCSWLFNLPVRVYLVRQRNLPNTPTFITLF